MVFKELNGHVCVTWEIAWLNTSLIRDTNSIMLAWCLSKHAVSAKLPLFELPKGNCGG